MSEAQPEFGTERFLIFKQVVQRPDWTGGTYRSVFHAWYHVQDVPKPVCVVTINEGLRNFVEWVHVDEEYRRQGIASEVMRAIEAAIGECDMEGATDAGEAWVEAYCAADETAS